MQTGVLDATITSSISFVSFRLYEQVQCFTAPGDTALWFMYQPLLMSKSRYDKLTPEQRAAIDAAAEKSETFFSEQAKNLDTKAEEAFRKAGIEVTRMSAEQLGAWRALARETSYELFAEEVDGGQTLIDEALAVE